MAIGAITSPGRAYDAAGNDGRTRVRDVVMTTVSTYTTGGSPILPAQVGLRSKIESVLNAGVARLTSNSSTSIPIAVAYQADGSVKLVCYVAATGAEQANGADLSTFSVRLTFIGT